MMTALLTFFALICLIVWRFRPHSDWCVPAWILLGLIILTLLIFILANYCDNVLIRRLEHELNKGDLDAEVLRTKLAEARANREQVRWLGWFGKGD